MTAPPRGHLTFLVVIIGGGAATSLQWGVPRGAAKNPPGHKTAPPQRIIQSKMTVMLQARSFDVNQNSSSQFTEQETILAKVRNRLDPTGPPRMKKNPSSELSGEGQGKQS